MAFFATSPSATHVSCLTWCLALFYSGSGRVCVYSTFLLLCKHQVAGFPSDCFPSLTHAAMHRQPQPRQCKKTDGGRKQLNSTFVGSQAHQGTRQQLMAPRTLAGKQGDFKVVAALCSLSSQEHHSQQVTIHTFEGCQTGLRERTNQPILLLRSSPKRKSLHSH